MREERIICHVIKANRFDSLKEIKEKLSSEHQIIISEATFRRRAKEMNIYGRIAKKNILSISELQRKGLRL